MPASSFQTLRLTIIACHGDAQPDEAGALFDAAGGSIGRAADNTLVLPDNDKDATIATHHARLAMDGDAWLLRNTSDHVAIAVNGRLVAPRERIALRAGDIVNIGAYVLRADAGIAAAGWNLPGASASALSDLPRAFQAVEAFNPLLQRPAPSHDAFDDRSPDHEPSLPLHDLLDTPLDPLALFSAPVCAWSSDFWNGAALHDPGATDLFADLGAASTDAFESQRATHSRNHAIRDDLPEYDGHLSLRISTGSSNRSGQTEAAAGSCDRESATVFSARDSTPQRTDYTATSARTYDASAPVVRVAVPDYSGRFRSQIAPLSNEPVPAGDESAPSSPMPRVPPTATSLIHAFLEGAGIAPSAASAVEAGFTPSFMRTLGAFVRALKQPNNPTGKADRQT